MFTLKIDGTQAFSGMLFEQPAPAPSLPLYMHREDKEILGRIRSCAPCPAVMVLKEDSHTFIGQQMQYFIRAINYNMTLWNVYLLFHYRLAFANYTGFGDDTDPRADWFYNRNLNNKLPQFDKVRTCSRNTVTGTEVLVNGQKMLKVWTFDSRQPPPLKPGRSYPKDISEVNPDDYLYMPERNPEKFLVANIVNARGEVVQFPRGALYPWFEGGRTIGSFLPHISNHAYGEVLVPLTKFVKVASAPSPYRMN